MAYSNEDARTRNDAWRAEVDAMQAAVQRQREDLADAQAKAARTVGDARSEDGLVRVVVDMTGTVQLAEIEPEAFRRSTPEALARDFTEAAQAASQAARQSVQEAFASILETSESLPDLSDLVPGAPSIHNPPPPPPQPAIPELNDDEPFHRGGSIMQEGW